MADEEISLSLGTALPVDQLIPFADELRHVFSLIMVRIPDIDRRVPEVLVLCGHAEWIHQDFSVFYI